MSKKPQFLTSFQMYFSLKFLVRLKWVDDRLVYQNLNMDHLQNSVPWQMAHSELWTPVLIFDNHNERNPERHTLEHTSATSTLIYTNGRCHEADPSQLEEAKMYHSNETKLSMQTLHFLKFHCDFDMTDFPFDQQTCFVKVSLQDKSHRILNDCFNFQFLTS